MTPGRQIINRLKIDPARPDSRALDEAVRVIRSGGVVAYPTEHFYALGFDPANADALARMFVLKGRGREKPALLAIARRESLAGLTRGVPPQAERLVAAWPAGLTILFDAAPEVMPGICSEAGKVALRLVPSGVAVALIEACGHALPATSANRSGDPASGDPEVVAAALPSVDLMLDAGVLPPGGLSTLVDVTVNPWHILRHGVVPEERLAAFEFPPGG